MFDPEGPTLLELARQALSSTERGYDLLAPKFDVTPFRTPDAILSGAGAHIRENLKPGRVLDLCCGTGAMLETLDHEHAFGLDRSRVMMEVAKRNAPSVAYVRADALHPPFEAAFDLVTCFSALGHFPPADGEPFVHAVKSCLRPGGHFVFVTSRMPSMWSAGYWVSRGFNAAMHVRNALWSPSFVMSYLTFLLPEATEYLEDAGFEVRVTEMTEMSARLVLVDARLVDASLD